MNTLVLAVLAVLSWGQESVEAAPIEADVPPEPEGTPPVLEPVPTPQPAVPAAHPTGAPGGARTGAPADPAVAGPAPSTDKQSRIGGAPNISVDVSARSSTISLGGDLLFRMTCRQADASVCHGGRLGLQGRFPVMVARPSDSDRASLEALDPGVISWRLGIVGEYIRDNTRQTGPAVFYQFGGRFDWGMQRFVWQELGGLTKHRESKHTLSGMLRFLAYVHRPGRYRVAPQMIVRYDRHWAGADPIGVVMDGTGGMRGVTTDVVVSAPQARPVATVTLLVLFTIQRGKWILPQLGFGPTLRYAVSGRSGEINPFSRQQTLRGELWIYWYPVGRDGLELPKTNVRIGLAPYVDGILSGRTADDPRARFGALIEVKLGVRGYEY